MILTQIREELGLKPAEFARRIGASPGQLHDWENGRQKLTVEAATKIEMALGRRGIVDAAVNERASAVREGAGRAA